MARSNCKAIAWVEDKATIQTEGGWRDEQGNMVPETGIDDSGIWSGTLPNRMANEIKAYARARQTMNRDCGSTVVINFRENGYAWAITYGTYRSTTNRMQIQWLPIAYVDGE